MKKIIALWKTILYFGIMLINDTYYRLALKIQPDGTQKPVLTKINRAQVYEDYTKTCNAARDGYNGQEVYSRTNNVIGVGIDYKF